MTLYEIPAEEYFPMVQTVIKDAFGVDMNLIDPLQFVDADIDRGMRNLVWQDHYDRQPPHIIEQLSGPEHALLCLESLLGFYNIIGTLRFGSSPLLFNIGPFRTELNNADSIMEIIRLNKLSEKNADDLRLLYNSIPISDDMKILATTKHLLARFIPSYGQVDPVYIHFPDRKDYHLDRLLLDNITSDYILDLTVRLNELTESIRAGNLPQSLDIYTNLIKTSHLENYLDAVQFEAFAGFMNTILFFSVSRDCVHPYHCVYTYIQISDQIARSLSPAQLHHLPYHAIRKYCHLVKTHSHSQYSHLIKSVVEYAETHLDEDLTLSKLAQIFSKNPSYLSKTFHQETGLPLTQYVSQLRINAAIKYINASDMPITEIALICGISDFSYFSRLFKKQVGMSPRAYRKMITKEESQILST